MRHYDERAAVVDIARLSVCASGSSDPHVQWDSDLTFPPRVHVNQDAVSDSQVCVAAPYVADALLAAPGGKNPARTVRFARDGQLDPVMLCEDAPLPTWRAIVMPCRF